MIRAVRMAIAWLCLLGLSACAAQRDPASMSLDLPLSEGHVWRSWLPGSDGVPIIGDGPDAGLPQDHGQPRAVILALHGFNDYGHAFQSFAAYAAARGIAVHAYDQAGFGVRPDRGLWPGTERMTADLRDAVARLRSLHGVMPLYILGESMGGAVAIVTATDHLTGGGEPLDVDGLILSAPAVWGGKHMNAFYRLSLWLASSVAPGWSLSPPRGLKIRPSDNIEMLRALSTDPLVIKSTRTDAIAGLVALMDEALTRAPVLDHDILFLMGEKDEIVPPGALEDFRDRLETSELTSMAYPDGYHMILRDLQRVQVYDDIAAWITKRSLNVAAIQR